MAKPTDDEDAFLYGSDDEEEVEQSRKRQRLDPESTKSATPSGEPAGEQTKEDSEDEGSEGSDDDSEDDIDIIIGDTAASSTAAPATGTTVTTVSTESSGEAAGEAEDGKAPTTTIVSKNQNDNKTTIDVHAVADYEGKPITQVDLETIKEKPWRAPGADISDYFNYGFDEFTWTAYCSKHDKLRGEFNPQKLMAQIMASQASANGGKPPGMPPGFPPMGMMPPGMPPMGMIPPGMPPGMPPMGMMPNMPQNSGKNSNLPNVPNMPPFPNMQNFMNKSRSGQK